MSRIPENNAWYLYGTASWCWNRRDFHMINQDAESRKRGWITHEAPDRLPHHHYFLFFLACFFFFFFRAAGAACGSSQAGGRGWMKATAASLHHSHSKARSLTHWARVGIEPASSWILVGFFSAEPQWELLTTTIFIRKGQHPDTSSKNKEWPEVSPIVLGTQSMGNIRVC